MYSRNVTQNSTLWKTTKIDIDCTFHIMPNLSKAIGYVNGNSDLTSAVK